MREIKFRGKRVDNGEWVYGYYIYRNCVPNDTHYIAERAGKYIEVFPETVGQYTGLHDKSNKKIYEHDIHGRDDRRTGTVAMVNGMWVIGNKDGVVELHWDADVGEVIGNIHAGPELLEK